MARLQRPRPAARRGRLAAADRATEVPRDLRHEPRRVLHDPRRRRPRSGRRADRRARSRWPCTDRGARADRRARPQARSSPRPPVLRGDPPGARRARDQDRHLRRVARVRGGDGAPLPPAHLPGADAARGRSRTAVPVHLQPVAQPDRAAARSRSRSRRVRPGEGAEGGPPEVRRDRQGHIHPARGHHRAAPRCPVPRDGDHQL